MWTGKFFSIRHIQRAACAARPAANSIKRMEEKCNGGDVKQKESFHESQLRMAMIIMAVKRWNFVGKYAILYIVGKS